MLYKTLEVIPVTGGEEDFLIPSDNGFGTTALIQFLPVVYLTGCVVSGLYFLKAVISILVLISKSESHKRNGITVFQTMHPAAPFTFLNIIFWNKEIPFNSVEGRQIWLHEELHIHEKHSVDAVLVEILKIFCWFNPFFYLMKRELTTVHEFLADQHAAGDTDTVDYAEILLLHTMHSRKNYLSNNFFNHQIKRRITMIIQSNKKRSLLSRLIILPMTVILFFSIVLYAERNNGKGPMMPMKEAITVVIDAGHGGIDKGAIGNNGMTEQEINLAIAKKIKTLSNKYQINIVMTRDDNNLPGNLSDPREANRERVKMTEVVDADLFVSIHVAASSSKALHGFEIYVSDDSKGNAFQQGSTTAGSMMVAALQKTYTTKPQLLQRKSQGIWVLNQAPCPALLIECGYITNAADFEFITDPANQEKIAKSILEGIVAFRKK